MDTQKLVPASFITICRDEAARKTLTTTSSQMLFARNNDMTWHELQRWMIRTSDNFDKAVKELPPFELASLKQSSATVNRLQS